MAANALRDVKAQHYSNGVSCARKAMVQYGMALGYDGNSSESQLTQQLQEIISKHRPYFEGMPVNPEDVETETDSE